MLSTTLSNYKYIVLLSMLTFYSNLSFANFKNEASIGLPLRIIHQISLNDNVFSESSNCSGSLVLRKKKLLLATSYHCLDFEKMDSYYEIFKALAETNRWTNLKYNLVARIEAVLDPNSDKKVVQDVLISSFDVVKSEYVEFPKSIFTQNVGEGILLDISLSIKNISSLFRSFFEVSNNTLPLKSGDPISILGYPKGKLVKLGCIYKNVEEALSRVETPACKSILLNTIQVFNSQPLIVSCPSTQDDPGGLSGGPAYTESGAFIGVMTYGLKSPRSQQPDTNIGENNLSYEQREQCYPELSPYFFISPIQGDSIVLKSKN